MSLFFHYHDTHDIPIGDRVLTEENNLVIIAENKKTREREYVAYIDDFSGDKPEIVTSDDLSYAERKNNFLLTRNDYFEYARKCNETFPHLSFYAVRVEDCKEAIHETHQVRGFHEEIDAVVHRPVGKYNRYAYNKEDITTSKEKVEDPKLKEFLLDQKILKAILLLRKCGNKASTKDEQIAEQKRWLKEGYTNEKSLDEWIQSLKEELAKTPEQKEKESQEFIEQLMAYEAKEALKELEEGRRTRSSSAGDYSPSNPWDAPGMSVSDFISVNSFGGHRL